MLSKATRCFEYYFKVEQNFCCFYFNYNCIQI